MPFSVVTLVTQTKDPSGAVRSQAEGASPPVSMVEGGRRSGPGRPVDVPTLPFIPRQSDSAGTQITDCKELDTTRGVTFRESP